MSNSAGQAHITVWERNLGVIEKTGNYRLVYIILHTRKRTAKSELN